MADGVYNAGIRRLIDQDWDNEDVRMLLIDDAGSYVFDKDHDFVDDISGDELSTTNYSRQTLTGKTTTTDNTDDEVELDSDDVVFSALGPSTGGPDVQAAVLFFFVTNDADSVPFLYLDSGGFPKTVNGEDFTVQPSAEGWVNVFQQ